MRSQKPEQASAGADLTTVRLSLERIVKRYGALCAVDGVSLQAAAGRLHMVVGENGAGKSTLLRVAAGLVRADAGEVRVDGAPLRPHTVREAISRGVGLVEQHFALVDSFDALENVMLGAEPLASFGRLDRRVARERAERVSAELGVSLPWEARTDSLAVGDRQRLEIVRVLCREARTLLLDEPTAVLTTAEGKALYASLRRLVERGHAVIVVTHRLDEVRDHADEVTVLRRGRRVSHRANVGGDASLLEAVARDAMGEAQELRLEARRRNVGAPLLELHDVHRAPTLRGVTLTVRAGEIVGIAGVEGNGQRQLVRVACGLEAPDRGRVESAGVAVVHEDRERDGLALDASVRDNVLLGELREFSRRGLVDRAAVDREARRRLEILGVDAPDRDLVARALSGGNRQKTVVVRALGRLPRAPVLVLAQPTRSVDVTSARAIHAEIAGAADRGHAVLLLSADLGELRRLCHRVLVLAKGRIAAEFAPEASDVAIGEAMLGVSPAGAQP
ncbi:MAG TPA: ATP-binding cassette domain-containing protein [Polyangiaceae bacterium]|nr:ATP-binding cassette domain-containing protein [Polyangiaceae bacterium]